MRIDQRADAREFLEHSESWLLKSEPENNLILGVARRYRDQQQSVDSGTYWATVSENGETVGATFRTPPHLLSISNLPSDAIPLLVEDVAAVFPTLPGVVGPALAAQDFARLWTSRFGGAWRIKLRQRIHVLTDLEELADLAPGALRRMEDSDTDLIMEWMDGFVSETGALGPASRVARPILEQRRFYLWDDDGPRCVVAAARETPHGACVNAVFTPEAYRRNGYATAAVAALTRMLLASGKQFCCLYTDLANPTSNAIYHKIGYRPVREDVELIFEAG